MVIAIRSESVSASERDLTMAMDTAYFDGERITSGPGCTDPVIEKNCGPARMNGSSF
jgi:hypothetical protein